MNIEKVVIIIPTYNESMVIAETLSAVFQVISSIKSLDIHVLVFDSHSTDATQSIVWNLMKTYPKLHLQTEKIKTGLGSAYWQAMWYALDKLFADIVIEFDGDLSHQPHYLIPILEKMRHYQVVIGSRYVDGGKIPSNWRWHRKVLSTLGNAIARRLLTAQFKDYTSGFRASRREVLLKVLSRQFLSQHYAYKLDLLWRLHQVNAQIFEYPIEFIDRKKGNSKLPTNSIFDSLRVLLILRYQKFISSKP